MQDENQTISDFTRRTDELAHLMGLNLSEIPAVVGISKAMLFAYRSGKQPISGKAWRRLAAAEANVRSPGRNAESERYPKDMPVPKLEEDSNVVREDVVKYKVQQRPQDEPVECPRIAMMERGIDVMSAQLEMMREALKQLKEKP